MKFIILALILLSAAVWLVPAFLENPAFIIAVLGAGILMIISITNFETGLLLLKIASETGELRAFGPADVFVMNAVLEHVQGIPSLLQLAKEVLKRDGLFVFSTMDFRPAFLRNNQRLLGKGLPPLTQHLNPVEHVNVYDYHSIRKTLTRSGFGLIGTGTSLHWADIPLPCLRNTRTLLRFLNRIEAAAAMAFQSRPLSITVYARLV